MIYFYFMLCFNLVFFILFIFMHLYFTEYDCILCQSICKQLLCCMNTYFFYNGASEIRTSILFVFSSISLFYTFYNFKDKQMFNDLETVSNISNI